MKYEISCVLQIRQNYRVESNSLLVLVLALLLASSQINKNRFAKCLKL